MAHLLGVFGSWAFILGGVMLLLFALISRRTESTFTRWAQGLTGVCGIVAGVLGLLG
ncbi:hypothetical protein [Phytomonospora endophytica]|uniref:Uncharacterized protein n=1 Tax=Phytomonospora endophytica TaxID=714109 RepID=A0A841FF15_9ACTN|nr:hypothetical protein [Phytomonospora endophytica]MBB6034165.1 hypothetical protein [Phytomonospora endophytica]GIG66557.1 hypothetical protein Pen01_28520 [Phytomonospora endophytica]